MKILNLYAGIGGNRKLWGNEHDITAVELSPEIAKIYKELYPNDNVIIGDAHEFLLNNYKEFNFIWASPPCQTHSKMRACGVWSNKFLLNSDYFPASKHHSKIDALSERKGVDLSKYRLNNKRQILRNAVEPEIGLLIFNLINKDENK